MTQQTLLQKPISAITAGKYCQKVCPTIVKYPLYRLTIGNLLTKGDVRQSSHIPTACGVREHEALPSAHLLGF